MAKGKRKSAGRVTNEKIMGFLVEMDERMTNMDERVTNMDERMTNMDERMTNMDERITEIKQTMATKDDLQELKEELLSEIRPIARAVDRDAETLIDHEKRITVLEKEKKTVTA